MQRRWRAVGSAAVLILVVPLTAAAQKSTTSPYLWWTVCGGNSFATCAAVDVEFTGGSLVNGTVTGGSVRLRVWNLSGLPGSSYDGTVFTGIGFFNTGSIAGTNLTTTGGANNLNGPSPWVLHDNKQIGGGVQLELVSTTAKGVDDGIATDCDTSLLPGGSNSFWVNPCETDPNSLSQLSWDTDTGWVIFTFDFNGSWNLASTQLLVKGQNGPAGPDDSTQCITGQNCDDTTIIQQCPGGSCTEVVPEPITILLLGTGLGGVAAARHRRRRTATPS